jgi:hypothetical protein
LAFAYLGGITSVNGALLGGVLSAGGLVAVFGNYHNKGFTPYVVLVGGVGMVLTAILHPEGQAPFWQPALQYLGRWLTTGPLEKFPKAILRVLPGMIPGALITWLIIWAKASEWRNWHLILIAGYGLMARGIGMRVAGAVKAKRDGAPAGGHGHGPMPPSSTSDSTPALAEA